MGEAKRGTNGVSSNIPTCWNISEPFAPKQLAQPFVSSLTTLKTGSQPTPK